MIKSTEQQISESTLTGGTKSRRLSGIPIVLRPVTPWALSSAEEEVIGRSNRAEELTRLNWKALLAGDAGVRYTIASRYLSSSERVDAGVGYERWIVQGALANADATLVHSVADLVAWGQKVKEGVVLMRITTQTFGARGESALEKSFKAAEVRIARIIDQITRCVAAEAWHPWVLLKDISYGGELRLAEAIANALFSSGDNAWGKVVYAKSLKSTHSHEELALEVVDEVLSESCNPGALAMKASLHGRRGEGPAGSAFDFKIAAEAALLRVAILPDKYAGAVGRRAMRNIGRADLSKLCNSLEKWALDGNKPPDFPGTPAQYRSALASRILVEAGRRDLAELQLRHQWFAEDWARLERQVADSSEIAATSVFEVAR
jgi:hypothetical protein